ncbi:MAG: NDP-hexose 2,3-dehydratase family protein [Bacilli bacterium]|nr:NDP-hexose 2,3-dehydratase family protein [Bacilli bacterium]
MNKHTQQLLSNSLTVKETLNSNKFIINKIHYKNKNTVVKIDKTNLLECNGWKMNDLGFIQNHNNSFFSIKGLRTTSDSVISEQPIIIQNEIGYLGIIAKEFNSNLYFLMQMKIEPGNINKIQISPTLQATMSNFQMLHGGKEPSYLNYFKNASKYEIIVDQLQSEQSSRFLKKRNRNVIIKVDEDIEVFESHLWMSLYQIKELLKIDNLVNMDTRTVISCIPLFQINKDCILNLKNYSSSLIESMFGEINYSEVVNLYNKLNDFKMYHKLNSEIISLKSLDNWLILNDRITSKTTSNFDVIFCNIEIEGREVRKWSQPLFESKGIALFGLFTTIINQTRKFLVKIKAEVGTFDIFELGPTIQKEFIEEFNNKVELLFEEKLKNKKNILYDVLLSEEGGRFYHEQNRNTIIDIKENELLDLPKDYAWVDYKTINYLIQSNNIVNIQLRNLMALLRL